MKLIISEKAERKLIQTVLKEEFADWSDKVNIIKKFLDTNFLKASNSVIGYNGRPSLHDMVIWVDKYKQPKQYLSDKDVFYILQDEFKNILGADEDGKHTKRDNFLKQCLKDWFYNKITKNGCLSLYEDRMSNFGKASNTVVKGDMKIGLKELGDLAKRKENVEMKFQDWDDISIEGVNIIPDINREFEYFNKKKSNSKLSLNVLLCDKTAGLNSPDVYMLTKMIYTSRAAFKWCIMCPKLAPNLNLSFLKTFLSEINTTKILNGESRWFKSKEERDLVLPFLTPIMRTKQAPFVQSDLKKEIDSATEMTYELNIKVEEFLDSIGFEKTQYDPKMLNQNNNDDLNISDFDNLM